MGRLEADGAAKLNARVKADVDAAVQKGYAAVKESHLADYQEMFSRVKLDLGQTVSDKTTDQLLAAYKNGSASEAEKRQLEVTLFQYGRYLTIASSREDSAIGPSPPSPPAPKRALKPVSANAARLRLVRSKPWATPGRV